MCRLYSTPKILAICLHYVKCMALCTRHSTIYTHLSINHKEWVFVPPLAGNWIMTLEPNRLAVLDTVRCPRFFLSSLPPSEHQIQTRPLHTHTHTHSQIPFDFFVCVGWFVFWSRYASKFEQGNRNRAYRCWYTSLKSSHVQQFGRRSHVVAEVQIDLWVCSWPDNVRISPSCTGIHRWPANRWEMNIWRGTPEDWLSVPCTHRTAANVNTGSMYGHSSGREPSVYLPLSPGLHHTVTRFCKPIAKRAFKGLVIDWMAILQFVNCLVTFTLAFR